MMERELLDSGFPPENMVVIPDEQEAIDAALKQGKRGDLMLVFADKISRSWKQVIYFKPEGEDLKSTPPAAPSSPGAPILPQQSDAMSDALLDGAAVIQDERGVRLARETDD